MSRSREQAFCTNVYDCGIAANYSLPSSLAAFRQVCDLCGERSILPVFMRDFIVSACRVCSLGSQGSNTLAREFVDDCRRRIDSAHCVLCDLEYASLDGMAAPSIQRLKGVVWALKGNPGREALAERLFGLAQDSNAPCSEVSETVAMFLELVTTANRKKLKERIRLAGAYARINFV